MKFKENIDDLKKWIDFIRRSITYLNFIEIIIVALLGIASSNFIDKIAKENGEIESSVNTNWGLILLVSILIYAAIKLFKIINDSIFPEQATDSISKSYELTKSKTQNIRKDTINESFTQTLRVLNNTTCDYLNDSVSDDLVKSTVEDGLRVLLKSFLNNLNTILEIDNSKYTVGAYIQNLLIMPEESNRVGEGENIPTIDGLYIIEDSLNVEQICIPRDLFATTEHPDCVVDIKANLQKAMNKKGFHSGHFIESECDFSINCNYIPVYCNEEEVAGCLFIVSEKLNKTPYDLKSILDVYCRIISNWIMNRENCVVSKVNHVVSNYGCCPPIEEQC